MIDEVHGAYKFFILSIMFFYDGHSWNLNISQERVEIIEPNNNNYTIEQKESKHNSSKKKT